MAKKHMSYDTLKKIAAKSGDQYAIDTYQEVGEILVLSYSGKAQFDIATILEEAGYRHLQNAQFTIRNYEGKPFTWFDFSVTFSALHDNFKLIHQLKPIAISHGLYKLSDAWLYESGELMVTGVSLWHGLPDWFGPERVTGSMHYQICGDPKATPNLAHFQIEEEWESRDDMGTDSTNEHKDHEVGVTVSGKIGMGKEGEGTSEVGGSGTYSRKWGGGSSHETGYRQSARRGTGNLLFKNVQGFIGFTCSAQVPASAALDQKRGPTVIPD